MICISFRSFSVWSWIYLVCWSSRSSRSCWVS